MGSIVHDNTSADLNYSANDLTASTQYWWRVRGIGPSGTGEWATFSFTRSPSNVFYFSGSPDSQAARAQGHFPIPFQTTAREKVRAAFAWGLLSNISPALGYFGQFQKVYTHPVNIEQVEDFPAVEITWNEKIINGQQGGNSLGFYNRIADVKLRVMLKATDASTMTTLKEQTIADIEQYFGTNFFVPNSSGASTIFNCVLESNDVLGAGVYRPLGEVEIRLKVYYRTSTTNINAQA
jgi:hypothetical protein